jgi:hypothetical protein
MPGTGGTPDAAVEPDVDAAVAPTPDAAVAPTPDAAVVAQGACTNADDQNVLAANAAALATSAGNCAFMCIADPNQATCAANCVQNAVPLSADCAGCFGEIIACTLANCIAQCIDPMGQACADCRATNCEAGFVECAGIEPR